ncbi:glycosyltransferase family 2 protein [Apiospora arundinis]
MCNVTQQLDRLEPRGQGVLLRDRLACSKVLRNVRRHEDGAQVRDDGVIGIVTRVVREVVHLLGLRMRPFGLDGKRLEHHAGSWIDVVWTPAQGNVVTPNGPLLDVDDCDTMLDEIAQQIELLEDLVLHVCGMAQQYHLARGPGPIHLVTLLDVMKECGIQEAFDLGRKLVGVGDVGVVVRETFWQNVHLPLVFGTVDPTGIASGFVAGTMLVGPAGGCEEVHVLIDDAMLGLDVCMIVVAKQTGTAAARTRMLVLGLLELFLDAVKEVDHRDTNLGGKMAVEMGGALGRLVVEFAQRVGGLPVPGLRTAPVGTLEINGGDDWVVELVGIGSVVDIRMAAQELFTGEGAGRCIIREAKRFKVVEKVGPASGRIVGI